MECKRALGSRKEVGLDIQKCLADFDTFAEVGSGIAVWACLVFQVAYVVFFALPTESAGRWQAIPHTVGRVWGAC